MNWTVGILAFALLYVPLTVIFVILYKRNKEIDRVCKEKLEQIRKKYGVKL